jgi:predicted amidophosphoribosyltransferase|tara:strand:- start:298 stop:474 length:177 start_codon:yes stop_codon:yes gene_type:complete
MNYCSNCGNKLGPIDKFYSLCGLKLTQEKSEIISMVNFSYECSSNILLGGDILPLIKY